MRTKTSSSVAATAAAFIAASAGGGKRPPLRVLGDDARGWQVGTRSGDALVLDEYGDLWWAKIVASDAARTIRACWPEEARAMTEQIERSLAALG